MQKDDKSPSPSSHAAVTLLPGRRHVYGPATSRRLAQTLMIYFAVFGTGCGLAFLAPDPHWQIFGLGLLFPGGGLLPYIGLGTAHGLAHLALAVLAFGLFMVAGFLWAATGNAVAPPATWLLLALLAAGMDHGPPGAVSKVLLPLVIASAFAAAFAGHAVSRRKGVLRRLAANRHLARSPLAAHGVRPAETMPAFTLGEMRKMRFLLDRALQPAAEFNGFEWLDQFQTAAVRYQLNFMGYALSMAQATRLPAFGGYLEQAQRQLIQKLADHRVWGYWRQENLWGNLRADPDPAARENVMFTGFCGLQMAMYHAASGRRDFLAPGSFRLRHPSGAAYDHDLPSLIASLDRERRRSEFRLIACEPNWIYPLCNTIAAAALRAQAPEVWREYESDFVESLENEFIDLPGRFVPFRSALTGFGMPVLGGAMPQALPCFFLNATLPDIAWRQWLLLRRGLRSGGGLGRAHFWPVDTGNYRLSRAAAYATVALAASELGDEEIRGLCVSALDAECPLRTDNGHYYRPKASVWAHAMEFLAISNARDGFRRLIHFPADGRAKLHIRRAPYPDVLVAGATCDDGLLKAVLYPGGAPGLFPVDLAGLRPGATYECAGTVASAITADACGNGQISVLLDRRRDVYIREMT